MVAQLWVEFWVTSTRGQWPVICFISLFLFRYTRLVVHAIFHWSYKSVPISDNPRITVDKVTTIIATLGENLDSLSEGLRCHIRAGCRRFSICVPNHKLKAVEEILKELRNLPSVEIAVSSVSEANKRQQVKTAIEYISEQGKEAKILILADDDITFPEDTYRWILTPLESSEIGAVGTSQRTKRSMYEPSLNRVVGWLFADYIERRNFEDSATLNIDGGISCLSGRMLAVRAQIIQNIEYLEGYVSEKWNDNPLNADDDNYLTRWLQENGWEIGFQDSISCQVETSFDHSFRQLWKRCVRWARSNWRSNWKSINKIDNWRKRPWSTYALYISGFVNFGIPTDVMLWWLLKITASYEQPAIWRLCFVLWWLFTKTIKRVGLYRQNLEDLMYLPVSILWGWLHSAIKLYALFSLNQTGWE